MRLSLSGRLLEGAPPMPTVEFIHLAAECGFDLVELRPHQVPLDMPAADVKAVQGALAKTGLGVSMLVIGAATELPAWLDRAEELGTEKIRVSGSAADIRTACGQLRGGLKLVYQMHSSSPFEDVRSAAAYLEELPDPRFGLMPEPANLLFAGETWSAGLFEPLRGRILGCNAQSIATDPTSETAVPMNDGRRVHYRRLNWPDNAELGLGEFVAALRAVGYDDFINFIDPAMPGRDLREYAAETARYARSVIG